MALRAIFHDRKFRGMEQFQGTGFENLLTDAKFFSSQRSCDHRQYKFALRFRARGAEVFFVETQGFQIYCAA